MRLFTLSLLATGTLSAQSVAVWDTSHGVYLPSSYAPYSANHDTLRMAIANAGYTLAVVNGLAYTGQLDTASLLIVTVFSAWNSPYTAAEAAAADSFRNAGGDVLVFTDNSGCPNGNLAPLLSQWGYVGGFTLTGWVNTDSITTNAFYAPLFAGVNTVYLVAGGRITAPPTADELFWYAGDLYAAGECVGNNSTTLVIGDGNFKQDDFVIYPDNYAFTVNIFAWLASEPCAAAVGATEREPSPAWRCEVRSGTDVVLSLTTETDGELTATLYDASGRVAAPTLTQRVSGKALVTLRAPRAGVYFVDVRMNGRRETHRAVVAR